MKQSREVLLRANPTDEPRLVYRNLTRKGVVWSIKTCRPCGQPPELANNVLMKNVTFKVSKKTQERVRKEGKRYVHAFVHGCIVDKCPKNIKWLRATYNPYKHDGFILLDGMVLLSEAKYAKLDENGLWVGF